MPTINKTALLKALAIVKPGLAGKEIIEQSTSFAFIDGRVVTYNDEISLSHPVEGLEITGAIKAEELYQLLNKVKKDEIDMEVTETEIILQIGKAKAGLTLQQEITLPLDEIGEKQKWAPLPEKFTDNLKIAMQTCATDLSSPLLTCVHIRKDGILESCDNYSAIHITGEAMPIENFLLPASAAAHVCKLNPTKIASGKGWVHFRTKDKTMLSCRIFEEQFPDISIFFKMEGIDIVLPSTLAGVVEKASIFSKRDHVIDEAITITLKEKSMSVSGKSETGWYAEEMKVRYSGDKLTFSISPYLFSRIITQTQTCTVGKNKIWFHDEGWEYVAMLRTDKQK